MIIAEFTLDHPILRETLQRVPGIELTWEDTFTGPTGRNRLIVWIGCDDFDVLDTAIGDDPSVTSSELLAEAGGRRLYRFDASEDSASTSIMPVVVEVGGVHQALTATSEGWRNRIRFPNREAFERVYQFCGDHEIGFTFNRVYEQSELFGHETLELSDAQLKTLIEAVDSGYLDIPRGSPLKELGERLDISESAASERFRRAVKKLIQQTVYQ